MAAEQALNTPDDESPPVDDAVRRQALNPHRSFIVQAPAGSGKTDLLTRRVLHLLLTVDEPEQILAITFTRKAASEMRSRVVEMLQRADQGDVAATRHEAEVIHIAQQVLQRDTEQQWGLMRNPQRLNMRTIDSLGNQLAHRLPTTSQLGAPVRLVDNADLLYKEAAQRLIENRLPALDKILLLLGNRLEMARQLMADLLARRDQWQRYVYEAGGDHDALRRILESMLTELTDWHLAKLQDALPDALEENLMPCLQQAYTFKLQQADNDPHQLPEADRWEPTAFLPACSTEDLPAWRAIAHALLTSNDTLRKRLTLREGFPPKSKARDWGVSADRLETHKQTMLQVLQMLEGHPECLQQLIDVRHLPDPQYTDEQWAVLSQLFTMLPELLSELQAVFAERAVADFQEVALRGHVALGTEDEPTDLALSMDLALRHILVDEFQDTSQTQFRLFHQLVQGWEPDDGRTFFAVGDPMQSIYRFREGDVALFMQAKQHGIGPIALQSLTLSVNFRSSATVTHWVNQTFAAIFPGQADSGIGAVPYSASVAHRTFKGSVDVHRLAPGDQRGEALRVAELCKAALDKDTEHTVAVLVRSRSHATAVFQALRENALSFESVDMDLIGERMVVRDLISLVMALRYVQHRLYWLALLRSPFVGLTLHDLHALMHEAGKATVIELLQDDARRATLSPDGQARVQRFLCVMQPALQRAMRSRLMPWVESVWLQLGGPVVCDNAVDRDAAERALRLLYTLEEHNRLWRQSVIEAEMGRLFAATGVPGQARIQVMTLHKSKGLEFDTVILPGLDRRTGQDGRQLLSWFERRFGQNDCLILAPLEPPDHAAGSLVKLVRRLDAQCDEQERLRLLYVACTRARRHLHLLACTCCDDQGHVQASSGSLLYGLRAAFATAPPPTDEKAPDAQGDTDAQDEADTQDETDDTATPLFQRLPSDTVVPTFSVFEWPESAAERAGRETTEPVVYNWAGREARDIGTVVHLQLQRLADCTDDPVPDEALIHQQLRNLQVSDRRIEPAVARVKQAVENTLNDERGRWTLAAHPQARSEWALSAPMSDALPDLERSDVLTPHSPVMHVVIDRTFVDDGIRWIIDYKTGEHRGGSPDTFLDQEQERYREQLMRYADIMCRIDSRPIRLGLYFPMLQGWREWSYAR